MSNINKDLQNKLKHLKIILTLIFITGLASGFYFYLFAKQPLIIFNFIFIPELILAAIVAFSILFVDDSKSKE